jgi:hypothetical protein
MPLTVKFAAKRTRKTKNCQKGYGCGNSCINKQRKCKKKFGDQASTYAGWLKKNGGGTKSNTSNSSKVAAKKFGDSHSDRRAKLDRLSNNKAVELIVKHTVDGQMDLELRTSVAELIDESKKKAIKNVGERVTSTVEKAGMSPTLKRKSDGKNIINPEYHNLTDDLAKEVLLNQGKFVKGKRNAAGELIPDDSGGKRSQSNPVRGKLDKYKLSDSGIDDKSSS